MAAKLKVEDLPPEMLKQLGIRRPRSHTFSKEQVRTHARVLNAIATLSQDERRRVLQHAIKVNEM